MFNLTLNPFNSTTSESSKLDKIIDDLLDYLDAADPGSDDYKAAVERLQTLTEIKKKENESSWKPSPDAILGAVASVATVALIIHHEKIGVVTSKALGFVRSPFK